MYATAKNRDYPYKRKTKDILGVNSSENWCRRGDSNPSAPISQPSTSRALSGKNPVTSSPTKELEQPAEEDEPPSRSLPGNNPGNITDSESAHIVHNGATALQIAPDLRTVIDAWDGLPNAIKAGVLALVRSAGPQYT